MKIAMICASPKKGASASDELLEMLIRCFPNDSTCLHFEMNRNAVSENDCAELMKCDALVFAFPLYYDGLPSHFLRCLEQLERVFRERGASAIVYGICNCGFLESRQCLNALDMLRVWTVRAGLTWGRGLAVGGGGGLALDAMRNIPDNTAVKRDVGRAMIRLSTDILTAYKGDRVKHMTASMMPENYFGHLMYKLGGEMNWRRRAKANGVRNLGKRA